MPYDAPAGPTIGLVGRVRARVSPSPLPGAVAALMTPDTSGRTGFGSLASAGLTAALVSRLQARASGSILYNLTWKASWVWEDKKRRTHSHRLIWRLRASPGRTSASDLSGWPTPTTPSGGQTTPPGTSATGRRPDGTKATVTLQGVAQMAAWPTPRASDGGKNVRTLAGALSETQRKGGPQDLPAAAMLTGFSATTPHGARLNPAHARWLLRLPPAWDDCMVTAMPSTRKRSRSS